MNDHSTNSQTFYRSSEELVEQLREVIANKSLNVITIDGKDGAGKSTLARSTCSQLMFQHIELDQYLIKKKDHFVDFIRYDDLSAAIRATMKNGSPIVVEGVCVLAVLERLRIVPDCKIYVKRTDPLGSWFDEQYFDLDSTPEEVFQRDREELKQFAEAIGEPITDTDRETLFHEIVRYHFKYKPHVTSDFYVQLNHAN